MNDDYEVSPGLMASDFAKSFLSRSPISLQAFCINERIDPRELPRLVEAVITEWMLKEETHLTRREAINHLINHIRMKSRHEQQTNHPQGVRSITSKTDRYSALERAADTVLYNSPHDDSSKND